MRSFCTSLNGWIIHLLFRHTGIKKVLFKLDWCRMGSVQSEICKIMSIASGSTRLAHCMSDILSHPKRTLLILPLLLPI